MGPRVLGTRRSKTPEQALAKGDFKFTLEGERLHGSWVLVRMKHDRKGGKRNNWLLIKHRDDHAVDTDGATILAEDRSDRVRPHHGGDRCRKGPRAEALHAAGAAAPRPMRSGTAATASPPTKRARQSAGKEEQTSGTPMLPDFIAPQLCETRRASAVGDRMGA